MASVSESRLGSVFRELFSLEVYKRTQGRRLRQLSAVGIGVCAGWGFLALAKQLEDAGRPSWFPDQLPYTWFAYGVPILLAAAAAWATFRVINWPRFADFLIATEGEMTKVSWPKKDELKRTTIVVLITLFFLAGFLLSVDMAWSWVLERIGVLQVKASTTQALLDGHAIPAALGECLRSMRT